MAEVCKGQIEEIDDYQEEREPEVAADPEVYEAEEKQVVGDIVSADVGGGVDIDGIFEVE